MLKQGAVTVSKKGLHPSSRKWLWGGVAVATTAGASALVVYTSGALPPAATPDAASPEHAEGRARRAALRVVESGRSAVGYVYGQLARALGASPAPPATAAEPGALATAAARALARWSADPDAREALLAVGGARLLDYLLDSACDDPSAHQAAAEHTLVSCLEGGASAERLLQRPGAVPRLLRHVGSGKASERLAEALREAAPRAAAAAAAAAAAGGLAFEDVQGTVLLLKRRHGEQVQQLALLYLSAWAAAGGPNRARLSALGLNGALADAGAEAVARGLEARQQLLLVLRLMRVMAQDGAATTDADMAAWARPALFAAADAAAAGDLEAADAALDALAACAASGSPLVREALSASHALPTLECLAAGASEPLRARCIRAVAPLAEGGLFDGEEGERARWRDRLLGWLTDEGLDAPLRAECVQGLAALARHPGVSGLQVAQHWLARLLSHLALRVSPYGSLLALESEAREQLLQDAVSVTPSYIKAVAETLKMASAAAGEGYTPLPADTEPGLLAPAAVAPPQPPPPQEVDEALANAATCSALEVLCKLVADDPRKQEWLATVGVLPLLERLCLFKDGPETGGGATAAPVTAPLPGGTVAPSAVERPTGNAPAAAASPVAGQLPPPPPAGGASQWLWGLWGYSAPPADADAAAGAAAASGRSGGGGGGSGAQLAALTPAAAVAEAADGAQDASPSAGMGDDAARLCVHRQTARLLAMLCLQPTLAAAVAAGGWFTWLQKAAASDDCRLASVASVALLHAQATALHAAQAAAAAAPPPHSPLGVVLAGAGRALLSWRRTPPRPHVTYPDGVHLMCPDAPHHAALMLQPQQPSLMDELGAAASAAALAAAADMSGGLVSQSDLDPQELAESASRAAAALDALWRAGGDARALLPPPTTLIAAAAAAAPPRALPPSLAAAAEARRAAGGAAAASAGAEVPEPPLFDVVFLHGIRGGPFVTWRSAGAAAPAKRGGAGGSRMARGNCWPTVWLAEDLPGARLLSVEYQAPVTGWEGESLSVPDTVRLVMDRLAAAGVGQRPLIFVTHSMGGLLVKEMLSLSLDDAAHGPLPPLLAQTRGVVFYSTPHLGSAMAALGWKLRHVPGAAPAPSVRHLAPGPHLTELNEKLRALHDAGVLRVLSFAEGQPTQLAGLLPRVLIVPFESAYPGFGLVHLLQDRDHIQVCKPTARDDEAYSRLLDFARACLAEGDALGAEAAPAGAGVGAAAAASAATAAAAKGLPEALLGAGEQLGGVWERRRRQEALAARVAAAAAAARASIDAARESSARQEWQQQWGAWVPGGGAAAGEGRLPADLTRSRVTVRGPAAPADVLAGSAAAEASGAPPPGGEAAAAPAAPSEEAPPQPLAEARSQAQTAGRPAAPKGRRSDGGGPPGYSLMLPSRPVAVR